MVLLCGACVLGGIALHGGLICVLIGFIAFCLSIAVLLILFFVVAGLAGLNLGKAEPSHWSEDPG
jgi:hypothetical protein